MMQQPGGAGQQPMAQPPSQQYQQGAGAPPPPYMMMMPPMTQAPPPQQQPMWAQQQQQQQPSQQPQPTSADEVRTLWIGDLQYWMDESYLVNCFSPTGELASAKVIRNKQTGQIEGYGFIEFSSRAGAERVLQAYNGTPMPNAEQNFRMNWASFSGGDKRDESPDHTIFVGDLAADVTDYMLQETFRARFPSVKGAKVVIDRVTGRTKGYGFVRFGDESEQVRAITEMNGAFCSTRPMRIGVATNKNKALSGAGSGQQYPKASYQNSQPQNENDPNNTTIFVGNLDSNVTDDHLKELFSPYGQLVHVKIPAGKRCGFVQFADRSCAEEALRALQGQQLGGQNIRLSWGRNTSNRQNQPDASQWAAPGGYYPYGQGYGNFGYAPATQDPNVYYGGYAGYGNYQQQPQQQQQQVGYS
ncbi:Polyadenylate-binding protein rbp45 [Turnera subulata]|uniref:Polyadenylate-binding protein rbp45 n=1 Tax=Turnera subulata TaxID=218843 RepID=A0A9Q0JDH0_9ROSI|nr:Polyadenylate-binding protein rbp45 [Turnera subulata]